MAEAKGSKGKEAGADAPASPAAPPAEAEAEAPAPAEDKAKAAAPAKKHRKAAAHPKDGPSVDVPISWVVFGDTIGTSSYQKGIVFETPKVFNLLNEIRNDPDRNFQEGANAVVVPLPSDMAEGLIVNFGKQVVKVASGKLPDLKIYPGNDPRNGQLWAAYEAAHPGKSLVMQKADWITRKVVIKG